MSAWLVIAAGDERSHAGNEGYADSITEFYLSDNTVPNTRHIQEKDFIVVWDKEALLGASVVEKIDNRPTSKVINHCPYCADTRIKKRSTRAPRFRCHNQKCKLEFDSPDIEVKEVTQYVFRYASRWQDLRGRLPGSTLRSLCESQRSQHSIRRLRWKDFVIAVEGRGLVSAGLTHIDYTDASLIAGGYKEVVVRARLGQSAFRGRLLNEQGENCAFSGPSVANALEAAHLFKYAEHQMHDLHAGLLLRRDLHSLFDNGLIGVNTKTKRLVVSPAINHVELYSDMDGDELLFPMTDSLEKAFALHFNYHREILTHV